MMRGGNYMRESSKPGYGRKFDHYNQRYGGFDPMLFALKKDQFVSEFRGDNAYDVIDTEVVVEKKNKNDPDICEWRIQHEIPPQIVPPVPVGDAIIPVMFKLTQYDLTHIPPRFEVARRGTGWESLKHGTVYESYFPLVLVPKKDWIKRKTFELKRRFTVDLDLRERSCIAQLGNGQRITAERNKIRASMNESYHGLVMKLPDDWQKKSEHYAKESKEWEAKLSRCHAMFGKLFEGSVISGVQGLLSEGRLRAAWVHILEQNLPHHASKVHAISQIHDYISSLRYDGSVEMDTFIKTLEQYFDSHDVATNSVMDDSMRSHSLMAAFLKSNSPNARSYGRVIEAWELTADPTYESLKRGIVAHYRRFAMKQQVKRELLESSPEFGGVAKSSEKKARFQDRRANDTCHECGEKGHWKRDCPKKPNGTADSSVKDTKTSQDAKAPAINLPDEVRKALAKYRS
jgi:hypothetical protein